MKMKYVSRLKQILVEHADKYALDSLNTFFTFSKKSVSACYSVAVKIFENVEIFDQNLIILMKS